MNYFYQISDRQRNYSQKIFIILRKHKGEERKKRLINRLIQNQENFQRILQLFPSELEDIDSDWYIACAYFSSEVLTRKIEFPSEVTPDLYNCLEEVWFENIKKLRAYEIWEENGDGWKSDQSFREIDYFMACKQIDDNLIDPSLKVPLSQFVALEVYLKENYLDDAGKLDYNKSHSLIERKACRIWGESGKTNEEENWLSAERYVESFYENIVPAVKESKSESIKKVTNAIQSSLDPDHKFIVNCFEVVLVTYFIKVEDLLGVNL